MKFGDGDGLDARPFARTLIALECKEDYEREHHREHGADERQRAGAPRRVGEPAAFGRATAQKELGSVAAVTTTTRMSGAIHVSTATYCRGAHGFAGSLDVNPALQCAHERLSVPARRPDGSTALPGRT